MSLTKRKVHSPLRRRTKCSRAEKLSDNKYLQTSGMQIDKAINNPSISDDPVVLPSKRVLDAIGERQCTRQRQEVIDELENAKFRMNKILSSLQEFETEDHREVLKSLYEATGEVPPRFLSIHMGLTFLPSTVPPDEVRVLTQMLSSSEKYKGVRTEREMLNQCFQEIWRLRYQHKYDMLQGLTNTRERADFQSKLLVQLSGWLEDQHETLIDSLDMACRDSEIQKLDEVLETQLHACVQYLITAFQKTREATDALLDKFRLLNVESLEIYEPTPHPPKPEDVQGFNVLPAQTLLKKRNKWDWASKKISDLLILAIKHTRNPPLHSALATAIALYTNMTKAAKVHLDALPSEEKAIRKLNKKLEETTEQAATDKQKLHSAIELNRQLHIQLEELKNSNKDAQEKCEQLSQNIQLLSESLTTTKQENIKKQIEAEMEKIQQTEVPKRTTKEDGADDIIESALQSLKEAETLKRELMELSKEVAKILMKTTSPRLQQTETTQAEFLSRDLLSIPTQSDEEETRESVTKRLQSRINELERVSDNLIEDVSHLQDNIEALKAFTSDSEDDKKRKKPKSKERVIPEEDKKRERPKSKERVIPEEDKKRERPESKERMIIEIQFSGKDPYTSQLSSVPSYSDTTVPAPSPQVPWMDIARTDCIETLKVLAKFASGISSMLSDFGAEVLARGMRTANTKIIRLRLHQQAVIRDISSGIDEFFSVVRATVRKIFITIQPLEGGDMVPQQTSREKSKNLKLEEQYRTLFFMHMRLCEVSRDLESKKSYLEDSRQPEEMATDVNQKREKWFSLEKGRFENDLWIGGKQVKTNWQMMMEAYFKNKLSHKCVETGHNAFQEIFDIFDEKMACLVKICYLKSQLPQMDGFFDRMRKSFSEDTSRQFHFEKYRQACYNRVMDKVNAAKNRMQELQRAKQEQMYNMWMVINHILLETGLLLICPRPKGMNNMGKYDKVRDMQLRSAAGDRVYGI
ncbi:uncharacterized protein LOC112573845 isoform X2 [Pomacea canaliculata]|uniref:uncharacterized protein LOC112573845 isoform X2 n=1 Tax=Pomacea canaliculata TaxID=400727 RepID=UPI000D728B3E|nr:uncharacterized protein LOC112573845 isoform X2 [Pomacea canaliculata]